MLSIPRVLLLFCLVVPFNTSDFAIHYTSSGGVCQNACGYHGYDYTWCYHTGGNGKKWDYCSLEEGLGASGQTCASACEYWGASYRSCFFRDGKWHYCGLIVRKEHLRLEYSQENNVCIDDCRRNATVGYFQCNTLYGVQRCSPFSDITPTGFPCHVNYRCAKYGSSVYRCQTNDSEDNWDYCGRKSLDPCVWTIFENYTSQVEICEVPYSQKEKMFFRRERRNDMLPFGKEEFKMAAYFIDGLSSVTSFPDSEDLTPLHFYKQDSIFCKGLNYTNMELYIDISNYGPKPIAHVIFPDVLNAVEVLRLAFFTSLHSTFYTPAYTITVSLGEPMLCPPDQ